MEESVDKKWYDKTWLVILLCFVFFPVGIYGIWKSQYRSSDWKIILTVLAGLWLFFSVNKKYFTTNNNVQVNALATDEKNVNISNDVSNKNGDQDRLKKLVNDSLKNAINQKKVDSLEKERKKTEKKINQKRQVLNCLIGASFKSFGTYTFYSNGTFSYEQPNPYPGYWKGTWEYIGGNKVRIKKTWIGKTSIITVSSYCEVFDLI